MPRQEFSESWLSHYYWHKDGDRTPWIPNSPEGVDSVYDGTITTQCDSADYAVTARDNTSVEALADAKKVIIKFPPGIVAVEFRFRFNGIAGDQHVLQKFIAAGEDYYDLVDVLTIDQGTQQHTSGAAGTGIWFCDTISSAGEKWVTVTNQLSETSNHIGRDAQNLHGYDRVWFVASTLDTANAGTTLNIDWKQL